jgi:hypothetical protein
VIVFDPWNMPVTESLDYFEMIDEPELRRGLAVLMAPIGWHMVQALPSARWSYIDGSDLDNAVSVIRGLGHGKGLYFSLNAVPASPGRAMRSSDVEMRQWFLVDIDVIREGEASATEDEKDAAATVAGNVDTFLASHGWPSPVTIDSGNGWHLLYRVDLPADKIMQTYLRQCLAALGARFDTPEAHVDKATHDAKRISKLPGTWVRKGPNTPERPHRLARLVNVPETIGAVSLKQIQAVAGLAKATPEPPPTQPVQFDPFSIPVTAGGNGAHDLTPYLNRALELEVNRVAMAGAGERNNALNRAAFVLGTLVALGLDAFTIEARLLVAARQANLGDSEALRTIASGLAAGLENPRPRPEARKATAATTSGQPHNGPARDAAAITRNDKWPARLTIRASEVQPKKVEWLWKDRIPLNFITVFAGRTGLGKSFVLYDIAARLSRGLPMPDGVAYSGAPCGSLVISEDPYEFVIVPRLIEAGADVEKVTFVSWEAMAHYSLSDTDFLTVAWEEAGKPPFLMIDPPQNFLGTVDEHRNAEVRQTLMRIVSWIAERPVACGLVMHVNKQAKGVEAINRVIGSVAWVSTSRVAHGFAPDPDNPHKRIMSPLKSNLGQLPKGLVYQITKSNDLAKVEWLGETDMTGDEAMSGEKKVPRHVDAKRWLETVAFVQQREWRSDDIKDAAREAGVSKNALWEAKGLLPIQARQVVSADGERHWVWVAEPGWPTERGEL